MIERDQKLITLTSTLTIEHDLEIGGEELEQVKALV